MSGDVLTYDGIKPGTAFGSVTRVFDQAAAEDWLALFPDDRDSLPVMPAGMVAAFLMRGFLETVTPRPRGNVHGTQRIEVHRLPSLGDQVITTVSCRNKEIRRERRWIHLRAECRDQNDRMLFTGTMGIIWNA